MPPLTADLRTEVCIVGAGIAGLTTAYLLARGGRRVVVLDAGAPGDRQTERTTGHLSCAIDDRYYEIERLHGADGARLAAESHAAAIDRIEAIVRQEQIDCDFERLDGYLFVPDGEDAQQVERELQAARRAGLVDVELLARLPWPGPGLGPCLRFPRQAQFHPLRYLDGLVRAIGQAGGQVKQARVEQVEGGREARVTTAAGPVVTSQAVVVATNTPLNDRVVVHTKQAPYRTYVIAGRIRRDAIPRALYWDTLDPYHYVRLQRLAGDDDHDLLIVGGEDHKTGQAQDMAERYGRLEQWARDHIAGFQGTEHRWSGQILETHDGLAFMGRNPMDADNVYIATGDSGMGLTHGTIAGMLLTDLIAGRDNPWTGLYDPARKISVPLATFVKENLNVARQYADWVMPGDAATVDRIAPGSGAVIRRGAHRVAVYRDPSGNLHQCSAACPHLGCVVRWNPGENTWDCPCHGSRFEPTGRVVSGPSRAGLKSLG